MKKTNPLFTLSVATFCVIGGAHAVGTAPAVFSNYGEIQSVKNYSSNPFWNKNSPYNQNFPKPIYATGADLNTGDCNRIVENLVSSYCMENNYCNGLQISDVRPIIMVQLSQLPGHNFATSCGGYIDSMFEKFQKTYGNTSTVSFPQQTTQGASIQIANPFAQKQTAEQKEYAERAAELERLQALTTPTATVNVATFPKTIADLSFTDRIANTTAGYEQYKNLPSYKKPDFKGEDKDFFNRLKEQNFDKYCERRPDAAECKPLREHNITYNVFGGSACQPTKYETGKGATITCVPTRALSTFLGWCTDFKTATTFDGNTCPMQHTIAKTDTDDKTYYAKWKCDKSEYEQTQTACTDPNSGGGSGGAGSDGDGSGGGSSGSEGNTETGQPEEGGQYFVWECRIKDKYYTKLDNLRQKKVSGFPYAGDYCDDNVGFFDRKLDEDDECISWPVSENLSMAGIINQKINDVTSDNTNGALRHIFVYGDTSAREIKYRLLSKEEADRLIDSIKTDITAISNKCSSKRAWWLFIDKVSSGDLTPSNRAFSRFDAYKDICIGGKGCKAGEVKEH